MSLSKNIALEVKNVSKSFRLPTEQASGIKQAFINRVRGVKGYTEQHVLKDISFTVEKGDFFGIVGRNGSGKSTLLKLISQIYIPDSGEIIVNGKLVPFIELGVGFNPELTGRENIYLNGALLGFSHEEVSSMYNEIVDFAELADFMDQKLKNYSSGMQVRLAFSIAIRADGDILVLDEVLAVGDEAFQRKCDKFFSSVKNDRSKTIILVTHSMDSVRKYCNKAMMIRRGKIVAIGSPEDVTNEYSLENLRTPEASRSSQTATIRDFRIELLSPQRISQTQEVRVKISYTLAEKQPHKVHIWLKDLTRDVPLVSISSPVYNKTKNLVIFTTKLDINNTDIRVFPSIQDERQHIIYAAPEDICPSFIVRRVYNGKKTENVSWALLNMGDKASWEDEV